MKGKYRYFIMYMLTIIIMVNHIDRGAMSYAQQFIIKEYGFNLQTWGQVLGFFGYGYIFGGFFGGLLADKKGPKFLWMGSAIAWSICAMMLGFAGDIGIAVFGGSALVGFAVFRALFGFVEGPAFVAVNATVANWAAPKEKAVMSSIGLLGVPLGAVITAPLAVGLISWLGWRAMFIVLGILGIIWALIWTKIFTNYPEDNPRVSKEELAEIRSTKELLKSEAIVNKSSQSQIPWYHFFKNPTLVLNVLAYFSFQCIVFLNLTWTPKYLQDVFNFELSSLWYLGMIPWIGACFTILLGAKISDYLRRKTNNLRIARTSVGIVSFFLTAICFLLILTVKSPWAVLTLMSLGNALAFLPSSLFWAIILDTEPEKAGSYGGITHFFVNIASIVAPTLTGFLVLRHGYDAMIISAAVAAIITMILLVFVNPGKKEDKNIEHELLTSLRKY
jgi:sugar phosphate permease